MCWKDESGCADTASSHSKKADGHDDGRRLGDDDEAKRHTANGLQPPSPRDSGDRRREEPQRWLYDSDGVQQERRCD